METFYDRLVDTCRIRGYTPSGLCTRLGIRKSFLSDLKSGRIQSIRTDTVCELARALNVTTDFLLMGEETRLTLEESELVSCYRHATPKERRLVAFILQDYGMPTPKD